MAEQRRDPPPRSPAVVLAGVLLAWLVLGAVLAGWASELRPRADEHVYAVMARTIADEGRVPGGVRPPGYPLFLAASLAATGGLAAARLVQVVLAAGSAWLVHALARGPLGRGPALLAAALVAFDPVLVGFSHLLWSETLYVFLLLAGLAWLLTGPAPAWSTAPLRALAAGACFGAAAFVRPQVLTFLPLLLAWLLWAGRREAGLRRAAGRAALVALGCGLVLLPWTLHHAARHGRLVVVSSVGPYNLLVGSDPSAHFVDKDDHWNARWGHLPEGGYAQGPALQVSWLRIVSRPGGFLAKSLWEAGHLWTLDSFPLRHLRNGWYGDAAAAWLPGAVVLCVAFTALLYAGGVLGLLAAPASSLRSVGLLALLHATLLFGVTFSLSRYAVPMRPLLALGAAWLAWHPRGPARWLRRDGRLDARRAVLAAGVVLLLGFAWWNDLPLLWDMLAHGGRDHRFRWLE